MEAKRFLVVGIKKEDLEDSLAGLSQLKPILQRQVMLSNGKNRKQAAIDSAEIGKHFDTAITAMTMLLGQME